MTGAALVYVWPAHCVNPNEKIAPQLGASLRYLAISSFNGQQRMDAGE